MENNKTFSLQDFRKEVELLYSKGPITSRDFTIWTGRGGKDLYDLYIHRSANLSCIINLLDKKIIDEDISMRLINMNESSDKENLNVVASIINYYSKLKSDGSISTDNA